MSSDASAWVAQCVQQCVQRWVQRSTVWHALSSWSVNPADLGSVVSKAAIEDEYR